MEILITTQAGFHRGRVPHRLESLAVEIYRMKLVTTQPSVPQWKSKSPYNLLRGFRQSSYLSSCDHAGLKVDTRKRKAVTWSSYRSALILSAPGSDLIVQSHSIKIPAIRRFRLQTRSFVPALKFRHCLSSSYLALCSPCQSIGQKQTRVLPTLSSPRPWTPTPKPTLTPSPMTSPMLTTTALLTICQ